jgi:D-glycero-alpha-D-manno-heptose 1-phosphate guanylyltransferase
MKEAIILAGGLGTRLRSVVADLPKCMAPVNGKPFLAYVIQYLQQQGIERFVFSLGYMREPIIDFLNKEFPSLIFTTSLEDEPLGTGGAIKQALTFAEGENILVTNGDTLFKIHVNEVAAIHNETVADCTLSLKPMNNFDRYGVVVTDTSGKITSFKEKQFYESGLINGGVYILNKKSFLSEDLPQKFSFEKDYLEKYFATRKMYGIEQQQYFIDIGIPEDYAKAQSELSSQ